MYDTGYNNWSNNMKDLVMEVNMFKNSSTFAASVTINRAIKFGFISINGLRETYFVDAFRIYAIYPTNGFAPNVRAINYIYIYIYIYVCVYIYLIYIYTYIYESFRAKRSRPNRTVGSLTADIASAWNLPPSRDKYSRDLEWSVTNDLLFL